MPVPILDIGEEEFEKAVLKADQPVLVFFWTSWSEPCKVVWPKAEKLAAMCAGKVRFVRVNADENPTLGMWYDVQYIPALLVFSGGVPRMRLYGTMTEEAILKQLGPWLGSGSSTPEPQS